LPFKRKQKIPAFILSSNLNIGMILFLWRRDEAKDFELNGRDCSSKSGLNFNFSQLESPIKYLKSITLTEDSAVFKSAANLLMRNQCVLLSCGL
jgi:hypothetical protein